MYALVEIGGHSHKVEKGSEFLVNLLNQDKGSSLIFDKVTLISDGGNISIGSPYLSASIKAEVVESEFKDKKITVFKYKNKTNYRVKKGHRHKYTRIKILDIVTSKLA